MQNNVTRLVGFLARHLFDAGEPDEALRRVEAAHERLLEVRGEPDLDFLNDSARLALLAGQDDAAARLSERVRAEVQARPETGRQRARDRKADASRALSVLAELRLRAGDLDAVQALWDETQALDLDVNERAAAWPPLLERFDAARREAEAERGTEEPE